jgi:DnaK suppressor protein
MHLAGTVQTMRQDRTVAIAGCIASRLRWPETQGLSVYSRQRSGRAANGEEVVVMTQNDIATFSSLLLAKHAELLGKSRQREDIWIVPSNEQIETVQLAGEREFAVRTLERESKTLTQVGDALRRMDDGEYGICVDCEEAISAKRLAAVPWADCCLHCQELRDAKNKLETVGGQMAA